MKLKINTVRENSLKTCFVLLIFACTLQNSDVSADKHRRFRSQVQMSSSSTQQKNIKNQIKRNGIPNRLLSEIRYLDNQLSCFPKLLCTIYQDDAIMKRNVAFNATELGIAYIQLLKAVQYSSHHMISTNPTKGKRPIIQIFKIPMGMIKSSTYSGRKEQNNFDDLDDYPTRLRSPLRGPYHHRDYDSSYDEDHYPMESRSPLRDDYDADDDMNEYYREKAEISQMMQDLREEDEVEASEDASPSFRGGLGSTFFNSFLPFMGARSMDSGKISSRPKRASHRKESRKVHRQVITKKQFGKERKFRNQQDVPQDAFWRAVSLWKTLRNRNECKELYQTCPFEAWEIVRMLDLVKGQAKVLSAYLKLTVDKVKPASARY